MTSFNVWFYGCCMLVSLRALHGRVYKKCDLARELKFRHNFTYNQVKNWVCIAEYESRFNTSAVNLFNYDGSRDFGLFQLNNRYWCGAEFDRNVCAMDCNELLDDDITDDIKCAKKVIKDTEKYVHPNGLMAWVVYKNRCQHKDLDEYISECKDDLSHDISVNEVDLTKFESVNQELKPISNINESPVTPIAELLLEKESNGAEHQSEALPEAVVTTTFEPKLEEDSTTQSYDYFRIPAENLLNDLWDNEKQNTFDAAGDNQIKTDKKKSPLIDNVYSFVRSSSSVSEYNNMEFTATSIPRTESYFTSDEQVANDVELIENITTITTQSTIDESDKVSINDLNLDGNSVTPSSPGTEPYIITEEQSLSGNQYEKVIEKTSKEHTIDEIDELSGDGSELKQNVKLPNEDDLSDPENSQFNSGSLDSLPDKINTKPQDIYISDNRNTELDLNITTDPLGEDNSSDESTEDDDDE